MVKLNLNENFVCRIWENSSYYKNLLTTEKQTVEIVNYGQKNTDAGPDYNEAKVRIGGILFSGSIEIHCLLNNWREHHHSNDNKYNNVILQVVFYRNNLDCDNIPVVKRARNIPTVILSEFLTKSIHSIWKDIINNPSPEFKLPCYPKNDIVSHTIKKNWLNHLSIERLKYKSERIKSRLMELSDDSAKKIFWEIILFEFICEALGYSKNKDQFLILCQKIELQKLKDLNLEKIKLEALLFGLSGFLKNLRYKDNYIDELKSHWSDLKDVFKKERMDKAMWNFFRLRPSNFPTLRIAYAAAILYEIAYRDFLREIIKIFEDSNDITLEITELFMNLNASGYWKNHYVFGKESTSVVNSIGEERIGNIVVNVLIPLIYFYGLSFRKVNLINRVEFYYRNKKYNWSGNEVTRIMEKQLGLSLNFLSDEQALIHLYNFYCTKGKCKECEIGNIVFDKEDVNKLFKIIIY